MTIWRSVTSGPTRDELVAAAMGQRKFFGWSDDVIPHNDLIVTTRGVTYDLMLLRGKEFATDEECTFGNVLAEATRRGWRRPPIEVALLLACIRQYDLIGLDDDWVVVANEPPLTFRGGPYIIALTHGGTGYSELQLTGGQPGMQFCREVSFVFLAPPDAV